MSLDVEKILQATADLAKKYNHRSVSVDHLFYTIISFDEFADYLGSYGTNVDSVKSFFENSVFTLPTFGLLDEHNTIQVSTPGLTRVISTLKAQQLVNNDPIMSPIGLLYIILTQYNDSSRYASVIEQAGGDVDGLVTQLTAKMDIFSNNQADVAKEILSSLAKQLQGVQNTASKTTTKKESTALPEDYCTNLNQLALEGKMSPGVGRDNEVEKIIQTIARKDKQNVVICGEPGTGKTAIIDGFVQRIVSGQVPDQFKNAVVYTVDIAGMVAGTRFRGEFEERLKSVIDIAKKDPNVILFIDEIHMIRGAGGSSENAMDAANILKPALASRAIRVIGATTHDEYRKHFEKDKALMRRFYKMDIVEPTAAETKEILHGCIDHFETFHGITYDKDALDVAVELAAKYIHDRRFPDKAFDIIDGAGAKKKLLNLEDKTVSVKDIETEVSIVAKVPAVSVKKDDSVNLRNLKDNLKTKIFGQDHVIDQLVSNVLIAKSGLRIETKPLMSGLFRGRTGTGKTEVAKQLAKELNIEFVRFDMSEYQEKHSVSRLIGAPPGYVGHGEGATGNGLLVNAIENTPHCVLLLDEIEKADPQVLNILLQVMDYGMLTSSTGKVVSFRNAIILMTSNLGAKQKDKPTIGFGLAASENTAEADATSEFFAPEFLARLDTIVSFHDLGKEVMYKVVDKFLNETNKLLASRNITVELTDAVRDHFIKEAEKTNLGARPIDSMITKDIKRPLSEMILFGEVEEGSTVLADVSEDGKITLSKKTDLQEPKLLSLVE